MIIKVCVHCNRTEIDWRPMEDEDDEPAYICTVCTDQQRVTGFRRSFVALHRNLLYGLPPHFPQELFGYVFPANYKQLLSMNNCKRAQRTETLRLLCGAPLTRNHIYDFYQRLQEQADQIHWWKGQRFRTSCWNSRTDIFTVLGDFLT